MITNAIRNAYRTARSRSWKKVYWAVDLHGVCFHSTYGKGSYKFIGNHVARTLKLISDRPETVIILWSSIHKDEEQDIIQYFADNGIKVSYFNHNPEIQNTVTGNFDTKFYFSVLLDDKAGFDPSEDWDQIYDLFINDDGEFVL